MVLEMRAIGKNIGDTGGENLIERRWRDVQG